MVTLATGICNEQGCKDKTTSFPSELTKPHQIAFALHPAAGMKRKTQDNIPSLCSRFRAVSRAWSALGRSLACEGGGSEPTPIVFPKGTHGAGELDTELWPPEGGRERPMQQQREGFHGQGRSP